MVHSIWQAAKGESSAFHPLFFQIRCSKTHEGPHQDEPEPDDHAQRMACQLHTPDPLARSFHQSAPLIYHLQCRGKLPGDDRHRREQEEHVSAQVEPFEEPRSEIGCIDIERFVEPLFGELFGPGLQQGKQLGKGRRVDVPTVRAVFLGHVDKGGTRLDVTGIVGPDDGQLIDPGQGGKGRVLGELRRERELTDRPRGRPHVTRHPPGDDVPSDQVQADLQRSMRFRGKVRVVMPRRRKDGVGDQETESRPRRRAFDKDPVEDVALVGKVPDVSGRFRSEVELGRRICCMVDGVPSDSKAAEIFGEGQISQSVYQRTGDCNMEGPANLRYDDADKDADVHGRVVEELANRRALLFDLDTSSSFGRSRRRARARYDCRICRRGRSRCGV